MTFKHSQKLRYNSDSQKVIQKAHDMGFKESAVLVLIDEKKRVIFTQRAKHLPTHKGQFSFAGGKKDIDDPSLKDTAIREAHEELGIPADNIKVFMEMTPFVSPKGFIIYPFIAKLVGDETKLKANPHEVDRIIKVPISFFKKAKCVKRFYRIKGMHLRADFYSFGPHLIWGATARIITLSKSFL